ncbi:alanine racemase C-terminal domain-containing protein, partial [Actinomadura sp. RB99]|uniref:alanine racemase C-terminal domain-containing protein n=1 Tax=Actinomadura sp. RB99 TaxID=2691577 RepID=UPI0019D59543
EPTAQEWAEALGTISYEIVTRIGARVPRAYRGRRGPPGGGGRARRRRRCAAAAPAG